ncbi:MAG TPA: transcription elongation factor subunit Spt4 [Candidatus Methanofastidiosa archaeon]|nr:transcription elongation factor subunit Spt4 [Candidatus Methanofastidiosa archaeon]
MKFACKECRRVLTTKECYFCKKESGESDWGGLLIVIDPERSNISKETGYKVPGKYALKIR